MQDSKFMSILIKCFYAFMGKSIIGDVDLVQIKITSVKHLLKSIICDVVID
jgi:hypothetical protein